MLSKISLNTRILLAGFTLLTLPACATLLEGSSQEVTFEAVGATNVMCNLKSEELSYKVYPPQRVWLKRSRLNLTADCYAPGNRHKQFEIVPGIEPYAATNVSNAGSGIAYDAYSRALFKYPDIVTFDMTDTTAKDSLLPDYHNGDGLDPNKAGIEYMGPKTPALDEDATNAARRAKAFEEFNRQEEFEAERMERMEATDPGVKK